LVDGEMIYVFCDAEKFIKFSISDEIRSNALRIDIDFDVLVLVKSIIFY